MVNYKNNSKRPMRHKNGVKSETIELLEYYAKATFQKIAEEEEEKKRFLAAETLIAFSEMARYKPVEQSESDTSDNSNQIIPFQRLNQNEFASDSSPSHSASVSLTSVDIEVAQILASQLYSQTAKVYEPETAEINSNVATSPNCSLTWSEILRKYPVFQNANLVTRSKKDLFLKLINRKLSPSYFSPCPKSKKTKFLKFKDYYDTIYKNNMLIYRHRLFYFIYNTSSLQWDLTLVNKVISCKYI